MKLSILKIIILLLLLLLIMKMSYNYIETFDDKEIITHLTAQNNQLQEQLDKYKIESEEINEETAELLKEADEKLRKLSEKSELDKKQIRFCENRDSLDNFMLHHKNRDRAIKKLNTNFKDLIEDNANLSDLEISDLSNHFNSD